MKKPLKKIPLYIPELKATVWVGEDEKINDVRARLLGRQEYKTQRIKASWRAAILEK
jgi:hypothetical protein